MKANEEYEFTFLSRGSVFPPGCWINESYKSFCYTEQLPFSAWEITRVFETKDSFVNDSVHSTKWAPKIWMNGFFLLMWDPIAVSSLAYVPCIELVFEEFFWQGPDHCDLLHKRGVGIVFSLKAFGSGCLPAGENSKCGRYWACPNMSEKLSFGFLELCVWMWLLAIDTCTGLSLANCMQCGNLITPMDVPWMWNGLSWKGYFWQ